MTYPLAGQRILITRAPDQAGELRACLRARGAETRELPTVQVAPIDDWSRVDAAIVTLRAFDWLVFTSPNGVRFFLERCYAHGLKPPLPPRLAAVGPATAEALGRYGARADLVAPVATSEGLARALTRQPLAGRRVLLARGSLADATLPTRLADAGAEVAEVVTYQTLPASASGAKLNEWLRAGDLDWITLASGSAMHHLLAMLPDAEALRTVRLATIGPKTSGVVRGLGFMVAAEARKSTMEGLAAAIEEAWLTAQGR